MPMPLGVGGRHPSRPIPWETSGMNLYQTHAATDVSHRHFRFHGRLCRFHRQGPDRQTASQGDAENRPLVWRASRRCFRLSGTATSTFSKYVTASGSLIIFGLLQLIGGNRIREAFEEDEENAKETPGIRLAAHAADCVRMQHRRIRRGREFRIHESQYLAYRSPLLA